FIADSQRRAMHVARASVVAQARPKMQHFIDGCVGQRAHIGKALHEALIVGNDGGNLSLLQHDLRDPHAIRRAVVLPGQIVTALPAVPLNERVSDEVFLTAHREALIKAAKRSAAPGACAKNIDGSVNSSSRTRGAPPASRIKSTRAYNSLPKGTAASVLAAT